MSEHLPQSNQPLGPLGPQRLIRQQLPSQEDMSEGQIIGNTLLSKSTKTQQGYTRKKPVRPILLSSIRLQNFKAIQDSGPILLTPLTVIIGNNGTGKSSLIEGLEFFKNLLETDLDRTLNTWGWGSYEHILNKHNSTKPMKLEFEASSKTTSFSAAMSLQYSSKSRQVAFTHESLSVQKNKKHQDIVRTAHQIKAGGMTSEIPDFKRNQSVLGKELEWVSRWQFLSMIAQYMGYPSPNKQTPGDVQLHKDGINLPTFLTEMQEQFPQAFQGLVQALRHILPYSESLKAIQDTERSNLTLLENNAQIPGGLLSTGTLRILGILSQLRHPNPPPLIVIDEIENGLDPRTIHLLVEEIKLAVDDGKTQVIVTTHSPYFLNAVSLSSLLFVERDGLSPVFYRPAAESDLESWSRKFAPGDLYTMGKLSRRKP